VGNLVAYHRRQHRVVVWKRLEQAGIDKNVLAGETKRVDGGLRERLSGIRPTESIT
jgi:hypothetical protein